MLTSMSAFRKFPEGDPNNNKEPWCFICIDIFEGRPASLTTEVHRLHTATSASVRPSVFGLWRLKCFHRSEFPMVVGARVYSLSRGSAMLMRRSSFQSGTAALSGVRSGYNRLYRYGQPYRYTAPAARHTSKNRYTDINHQPLCLVQCTAHSCLPSGCDTKAR